MHVFPLVLSFPSFLPCFFSSLISFTVFSLAIFHCFSYKLGGCVSPDIPLHPVHLPMYLACTGIAALSCEGNETSRLVSHPDFFCPFLFSVPSALNKKYRLSLTYTSLVPRRPSGHSLHLSSSLPYISIQSYPISFLSIPSGAYLAPVRSCHIT